MMFVELKTADEVRAHARMIQRRINAQRAGAKLPEPPPRLMEDDVPHDIDEQDEKPLRAAEGLISGHPTRAVLTLAAEHFGLTLNDVTGVSRGAWVNLPRYIGFYVARRLGASLHKIARAGNRDHSTVLHGCRAMAERISHDDQMAQAVDAVGMKAAAAFDAHWMPVRSER